MSLYEAVKTDIEDLAGHTLNVARFAAEVEQRLTQATSALADQFDAKLAALKAELLGPAKAGGSPIVAEVGAKLAALTGAVPAPGPASGKAA